jgi:hypothetical protein
VASFNRPNPSSELQEQGPLVRKRQPHFLSETLLSASILLQYPYKEGHFRFNIRALPSGDDPQRGRA